MDIKKINRRELLKGGALMALSGIVLPYGKVIRDVRRFPSREAKFYKKIN